MYYIVLIEVCSNGQLTNGKVNNFNILLTFFHECQLKFSDFYKRTLGVGNSGNRWNFRVDRTHYENNVDGKKIMLTDFLFDF